MIPELLKKAHLNQTLFLERDRAIRAAGVVAKARRELIRKSGKTVQGVLGNLESVLGSLDADIISSLKLQGLLEEGFNQGKALVDQATIGTGLEGVTGAFSPVLSLFTLSNETSEAANQIKGLSQDLKDQIKGAIEIGLAQGQGTQEMMERIFQLGPENRGGPFRNIKHKAEMRARTVSNDLVNAGKQRSFEIYKEQFPELDLAHEWVNVSDTRSSDICRALNGQIREIGESFEGGGWSGQRPPAHPFAYHPSSTVISPVPELLMRMWYQGRMVEITTKRGNKLTITEDHPVLTHSGFKAAIDLCPGDSIIETPTRQGFILGTLDDKYTIPCIQKSFESSKVPFPHGIVEIATVDLDSKVPDHNVNVEPAYRYLSQVTDPISGEPLGKPSLIYRPRSTVSESPQGTCYPMTRGEFLVSPSLVSSGSHSFSFCRGLISIEDLLSLSIRPESLAFLVQYAFNYTFIASQHSGQLGSTSPLPIPGNQGLSESGSFDSINLELGTIDNVRVFDYEGHVFHLQDGLGFQLANGIVAHNCRSTLIPVVRGELKKPEKKEYEGPPPVNFNQPPKQVYQDLMGFGRAKLQDIENRILPKRRGWSKSYKKMKELDDQIKEKVAKGEKEGIEELKAEKDTLNYVIDSELKEVIGGFRETLFLYSQEEADTFFDGLNIDSNAKKLMEKYNHEDAIKTFIKIWGKDSIAPLKNLVLEDKRAWARRKEEKINIGDKGAPVLARITMMHEMTHFIEYRNPDYARAAKEYILDHATEPRTKKLSEITGIKDYDDSEVAFVGDFSDPYAAKWMRGDVTELLTMGAQTFFDAAEMKNLYLKKGGKDHLAFVLGVHEDLKRRRLQQEQEEQ